MAALVADIWTIFYAILVVGWQITVFLKDKSWPALPLSSIFRKLNIDHAPIYTTASTGGIEKSPPATIIDALLRIPAIIPLLLAMALLTAFYLWLTHTEKKYLKS
jgi:hypothetical protein